MLVDLITITSGDGMTLDGIFCEPAAGVTPKGPVDAMLLIHGSGGSFYRVATKAMAEDLRNRGYACLAINTKGHDTVWSPQGSGEYYGNALEILDNSRHDLRAGIDYLWEKGYRRIGLLGHSMGAVKVGYYAATEDDDRITTVIPISPVRLSYSYYMESEDAEVFRSIIERADQMEAEDRALELMEVRFPIAQMFSAASYLDKHGPAERYNLVVAGPQNHGAHAGNGRRTGDPYPASRLPPGHDYRGSEQPPRRVPHRPRRQPFPAEQHGPGFGQGAGMAGIAGSGVGGGLTAKRGYSTNPPRRTNVH